MRKIFHFLAACLFTLPVLAADNPWGYPGDAVGYWAFENTLINIADFGETKGVNHGGKFVEGRHGKAVSFDGEKSYVTLGNSGPLQIAGNITLAAWVKLKRGGEDTQNILMKGISNGGTNEIFLRTRNETYQAGSWDVAADWMAVAKIADEDYGNWVHLAGTYDGESWRLYKNGVEIARSAGSVGAVPVDVGWAVGANAMGTQRFLNGTVDEVRIYARPLTPKEIRELAYGEEK